MVRDDKLEQELGEVISSERKLALGYDLTNMAAQGVTDALRHIIAGRCMDANCIIGLMRMCQQLTGAGPASPLPHHPAMDLLPRPFASWLSRVLTTLPPPLETIVAEEELLSRIVQTQERASRDAGQDGPTLARILEKEQKKPLDRNELRQCLRRKEGYRGNGSRLMERMANGKEWTVPPPEEPDEVREVHLQAGPHPPPGPTVLLVQRHEQHYRQHPAELPDVRPPQGWLLQGVIPGPPPPDRGHVLPLGSGPIGPTKQGKTLRHDDLGSLRRVRHPEGCQMPGLQVD